ncbi:MAG: hypothetical protein ACFFDQ_03175 [Candidatus Thorarchaeota archaeon]
MSPRKEYFEQPLVRVNLQKAQFPKTCPVCGATATKVVRMKISKTGNQYLRRSWQYTFSPYLRVKQRTDMSDVKVLPIQVCKDHANPDEGTDRYQTLCIIVDGLLMAFVIFSLLIIGDQLSRGLTIDFWPALYISLFGVALLLTAIAFRPNVIEKAVTIIGFDPGLQNVLLSFKRSDYREQFIHTNQMTAELVSWIVRSEN